MKLNIGCGSERLTGYIGIDCVQTEASDVVAPAWHLPYRDGEVEEIFTSHMIEHLRPSEYEMAIREWRRVLQQGGKLTIRCPNFNRYIEDFRNGDEAYRWTWGIVELFGWQDRGEAMEHHTGFTVKRLQAELPKHGFTVMRCEAMRTRQSRGPEYRPDGDIICEAVKA